MFSPLDLCVLLGLQIFSCNSAVVVNLVGQREAGVAAKGEEDGSEIGDVSIASSVGLPEEPATPASGASIRKKRARMDAAAADPSTPVAPLNASMPGSDEVRSSTGGDPSTKIRIPYAKLRGSGFLNSPLFHSMDPAASEAAKLKVVYSKSPERSGVLRLDFPELSDYPATARALSAVGKGDQYGTVAKREVEALRDEFARIRVELRGFDMEVRRELEVMAETRSGTGLPDPRASPAMQRRRTEEAKVLRQSTSSAVASAVASAGGFVDPNKKRLKKHTTRSREEDESESIDVLDLDAKAKAKRDQRKREKEALEAPVAAAGESKKYNLKARAKDNKKPKAKKDEDDAEAESGEDGESLDAANLPSNSGGHSNPYWAFVHQFIRDLVEDDLALLQPRQVAASDPALYIPPLGRHWTENRKQKNLEDPDGNPDGAEGEVQPVHCGDLTQRILASLIEDKLLPAESMSGVEPTGTAAVYFAAAPASSATAVTPSAPSVPPPSSSAPAAAPPLALSASAAAAQLQLDSSAFEFPESEAALPLSAPPTGDYSFTTMLSLEERIKMELKAMGLFDPEENPLNPAQEKEEDNEIVQEIKALQQQLREQVAKSNGAREKIMDLAVTRMAEQKKDRDVRGAHAELEKAYIRVMQRRKPKRKKGPGRKSAA